MGIFFSVCIILILRHVCSSASEVAVFNDYVKELHRYYEEKETYELFAAQHRFHQEQSKVCRLDIPFTPYEDLTDKLQPVKSYCYPNAHSAEWNRLF